MRILSAAFLQMLVIVVMQGCARLEDRPELYSDRWAPSYEDREWNPAPAALQSDSSVMAAQPGPTRTESARPYDLPALVDVALQNNPTTRRTWSMARAAAARYGAAQAPYYPQVSVSSDNGYQRTIIELPGTFGVLKQWQADPILSMSWTDGLFGGRPEAVAAFC